jgi:hypothetical protein
MQAAKGFGAFAETGGNDTAGGNGAPASRNDGVPPAERLNADQLLGQV